MDYVRTRPILPDRGSVAGRALLERGVVHIADVLADPEFTFSEAQKRGNYRTVLAIPLLREGTPVGAIVLTRVAVRPFTDKQVEVLRTFADQAVIAIENARLFDEVQARTAELTEALTAQLAAGARHLTVDLSRLRFADSAVIRTLVLADRTPKQHGGGLALAHPQPVVARALSLLGVDQAIEIRDGMNAGADPDR